MDRGRQPLVSTIGTSVLGRPIHGYLFRGRPRSSLALILGGFHGDEPKGVFVCRKLVELFQADPPVGHVDWLIVPIVNPDGYARRKRRNAHHIDLNRNFPASNWSRGSKRSRMFGGEAPASEPETQALLRLIRRRRPAWIITVHSIGAGRHCNNYDGPGRRLATAMGRFNGYPVRGTIGYATPGSFGTWAGIENGIPTVTLELPSLHSPKRCWADNFRAILSARPHGMNLRGATRSTAG